MKYSKSVSFLSILLAVCWILAGCASLEEKEQKEEQEKEIDSVAELIDGITEISYIQAYSDNAERVTYVMDTLGVVASEMTMKFDFHSISAASAIAESWKSVLMMRAVYTATKASAGEVVKLEVIGASASDGILSVTVSPRILDTDFIRENLAVSVALIISAKDKQVSSDYVKLTPVIEETPFINYMLTNFDSDKNGRISDEEAAAITEINLSGMNLTSLDFIIAKMTSLKRLDCSQNQLTSLNGIEKCVNLEYMNISDNKFTELEAPGLPKLKTIVAYGNTINRINLNGDAQISELYLKSETENCISGNAITVGSETLSQATEFSLHLDGTNITSISVSDKNITSLDVSGNTQLTKFRLYSPKLAELDLSGNVNLVSIYCSECKLNVLDISEFTKLKYYYNGCSLTGVDVTNNKNLTYLYCNGEFTTLDISQNAALDSLDCSAPLSALDLSRNSALTYLSLNRAELPNIDLSANPLLTYLRCAYCGIDIGINLSNLSQLEEVCVYMSDLPSLNLANNQSLVSLSMEHSRCPIIDVSDCTSLKKLYCSDGNYGFTAGVLTNLDVTGCSSLEELYCSNNQLVSLDVSSCTSLQKLYCSKNQLTSLDVSSCTALVELDCSSNQLTNLDVSMCLSLKKCNSDSSVVCPSITWILNTGGGATSYYLSDGTKVDIEALCTEIDGMVWKQFNVGASETNLLGDTFVFSKAKTACPSGWRLPTSDEFEALATRHSSYKNLSWKTYGYYGNDYGKFFWACGHWVSGSQKYSDSVPSVFLLCNESSKANCFWSSSATSNNRHRCLDGETLLLTEKSSKSDEALVRCIKE